MAHGIASSHGKKIQNRAKKKRNHTKKRKHSKKRSIDKKRKKRRKKKKKCLPRSGDNISGVIACVLGVGAFALALWLRVRPKDRTLSSVNESEPQKPSFIDSSELDKP
eukprot:731107_1